MSVILLSGGSESVDKAIRRHDGAGDFPAWLRDNREAPRPTLFVRDSERASDRPTLREATFQLAHRAGVHAAASLRRRARAR